ncbi:hypothetical protein GCM10008927_20320 [Amylibacter ulvae]|uniref:Uncharacterized protein n=1 Tax=Paramylibacter ulvae TaxID=1651968 RepID=A0ABQ3D1X7_9RHOB|nr:hypothetical protein [Amylibacter ulvae]GHA54460.1 hypothetical protein GCM10008927_20320 [Amylibacter ulvae]
MKSIQNEQDAFLNDFFDAEKASPPMVTDQLMVAVLDDAATMQTPQVVSAAPLKKSSFWEQISNVFGGWQVAATFATCVCLGIGLGYSSSISELVSTDYAVAGEEEFQLGLSGLFDVAEL